VCGALSATAFAGTSLLPDASLRGYVGDRFAACVKNQLSVADVDTFARVFRAKDETWAWQSEFWGKYMHSICPVYARTKDPALKAMIDRSTAAVIATQLPDGYIGNYQLDKRSAGGWDVWGNKYTLLGLIHVYDATGNKAALDAAKKLADYLIATFGDGKRDIKKTGNCAGQPSCSVLEPIVWLYERTHEKRYLDFAAYVRRQMDAAPGARLVSDALAGKSAYDRADDGDRKGSLKAYEMMSCYQGLLEYYQATGEKACLDAAVKSAVSIAETEVNVVGGAASCEHWYKGTERQDKPYHCLQETCVTITWMRLCEKLLEVTNDPRWGDEFEKTFFNAYLASLMPDGSEFAMYTPLNGSRAAGQHHCKMHTNCCNANGPRGFLSYLRMLLTAKGDVAYLNHFGSSTASVKLPASGETVTLEQYSTYPNVDHTFIWNRTEKPLDYTLAIRIPGWSKNTKVWINGEEWKQPIASGRYLEIKRTWKPGDRTDVTFDFTGRVHVLPESLAFTRGPIVLARDRRFGEMTDEPVRRWEFDVTKPFEIVPVTPTVGGIWMEFAITLPLGLQYQNPTTDRPTVAHFCDYASAGSTWNRDSAYRVWLPREMFEERR